MSYTTATTRSLEASSPPRFKKCDKDVGKKAPTGRGKPYHQRYHKRQDNDNPKDNELLHRLSLPSTSPPGTLLERIGGSAEDEVASTLTDSDPIIDGRPSRGDSYANLPFSSVPHVYTPEPGEVERFLESVPIGVSSSAAREQSGPVHTCSEEKPALALETHNLRVDRPVKVEDPSSPVLSSSAQTAVNHLPSAGHALDHFCQLGPLLDDNMSPPSASTIEECRKRLVPVLLASAQARDPPTPLDSERCLRLLSENQCRDFLRQAKEMKYQLSSLTSQKSPVHQDDGEHLKRDRDEDEDPWVRDTRSRFHSMNTVVSDVSRKDCNITLVDSSATKSPPTAPRAMLKASRPLIKCPNGAKDQAPYEALQTASTTTQDHPSSTSFEPVQHATQLYLPPVAVAEIDTCAQQSTGDQPTQVVSPTRSASADFVSHLPTHSGIWFKQLGRRYAEIVDIHIEVSDEMFYVSRERLPFRLRMHLRLCSVPVDAVTKDSLQDTDGAIERHAFHWPKKGKLVVQVNPESERSKTWLPHTLESDPLDVTSCVRPGKNTFRFIQLSDLSDFTFVLVASSPPPGEEWRDWDWPSLFERSRTGFSTDGPAGSLSEFAHLPVVVRS